MRLREYQQNIEQCIIELNKFGEAVQSPGLGLANYKLQNHSNLKKAIQILANLKICQNEVEKLKQYENIYLNIEPQIEINSNTYTRINDIKNSLVTTLTNMNMAFNNILPEENEETINIKLPEYSSIDEYTSFFKDLDLVFYIFKLANKNVDIKGFDSGSEWLNILIAGSIPCLTIFYKIIDKALELRNKFYEGQKLIAEEELTKKKIQKEDIEIIEKSYQIRRRLIEDEYNDLRQNFVKDLIEDLQSKLDEKYTLNGEDANKISLSLERAGELIDKGMEIHPAMNSPAEIDQLSNDVRSKIEEHKRFIIGVNEQYLITDESKNKNKSKKKDSK